jgi:tight adherence protein B
MELTDLQILVLVVAGTLALLIIIVGIFLTRRDDNLIEMRLGQIDEEIETYQNFVPEEESYESSTTSSRSVLDEGRKLLDPLNEALSDRKFGKNWRRKLARANLKLTPAEFALSHVASTGIFFTVGYIILWPNDIIMSTVAGMIGLFFPRFYVGRLTSKRLIAFEEQLPDTLGLWVNALRSGYSVLQAMEAIAHDAAEPTRTEFDRVVREVQLGIDMPEALDHLLERMDSADLDLVVTAVNIQREVGGNLAEILEVISGTIRERIKLKGEIRVLTSQGRITGYLISGLPIILALFLNFVNPGYVGQLFTNQTCGWPMLGAGLALIGIGTALIQKIVDIEI